MREKCTVVEAECARAGAVQGVEPDRAVDRGPSGGVHPDSDVQCAVGMDDGLRPLAAVVAGAANSIVQPVDPKVRLGNGRAGGVVDAHLGRVLIRALIQDVETAGGMNEILGRWIMSLGWKSPSRERSPPAK